MSRLTDAEFGDVRSYLVDEAGLVFDESRRAGLNATLVDRMATSGASDVAGYLAALRGKDGQAERQRLLDAVTVQETHFFRNPPQMEALRRKILPDLLGRAGGRKRPLTIWSAGCSTGEEPYTLAMLLLELSPMLGTQTQARILGTDVSSQALRAAGRATYTGRTLDATPPMVRDRWLEPEGGSWTVKEQARRLVELRLHNLVTDPAPFGPGEVDLIVCRNVTIYFDRETTAAIMSGFAGLLAEGGYLLLGHSETLWQMSEDFTVLPVGDAFVYRRSVDVPAEPQRGGTASRCRRPGQPGCLGPPRAYGRWSPGNRTRCAGGRRPGARPVATGCHPWRGQPPRRRPAARRRAAAAQRRRVRGCRDGRRPGRGLGPAARAGVRRARPGPFDAGPGRRRDRHPAQGGLPRPGRRPRALPARRRAVADGPVRGGSGVLPRSRRSPRRHDGRRAR